MTLCERCQKEEGESLHTCPYQCDMNNDKDFTCNCCDRCQADCAGCI